MGNGTRLRHLEASTLEELEIFIEELSYKVHIIDIKKVNNKWLAFFVVGDFMGTKYGAISDTKEIK